MADPHRLSGIFLAALAALSAPGPALAAEDQSSVVIVQPGTLDDVNVPAHPRRRLEPSLSPSSFQNRHSRTPPLRHAAGRRTRTAPQPRLDEASAAAPTAPAAPVVTFLPAGMPSWTAPERTAAHEGPSQSSPIARWLPAGTSVPLLGRVAGGDWYAFAAGDAPAFVLVQARAPADTCPLPPSPAPVRGGY